MGYITINPESANYNLQQKTSSHFVAFSKITNKGWYLPADDSHGRSCLIFFKLRKISQNSSSASVVNDSLMVS